MPEEGRCVPCSIKSVEEPSGKISSPCRVSSYKVPYQACDTSRNTFESFSWQSQPSRVTTSKLLSLGRFYRENSLSTNNRIELFVCLFMLVEIWICIKTHHLVNIYSVVEVFNVSGNSQQKQNKKSTSSNLETVLFSYFFIEFDFRSYSLIYLCKNINLHRNALYRREY